MDNRSLSGRSRRARIFWFAAAGIVAAGLVFVMWPQSREVEISVIDRGDVRVELVDEGRTRMHDVYVLSAPVAGRLLRVDVEPGDRVKRGDVVARMARSAAGFLDTRSDEQARATVASAEASLRSARAQADLASRELNRMQRLASSGLVSVAAVDEARARLEATAAARDAATAELARARSALVSPERVVSGVIPIRVPVDGVVLRVPQESEAVVAPGVPLVEIGDPGRMEVIAEFLSQDAVRIRPGVPAFIENWGGPALAATVERIEPVAHTKVSALGVEEQRANVILRLAAGTQADALGHDFRVDARILIRESRGVVRVPLGALFRQGESWATFLVRDGRAHLVLLDTGDADTRFRVVNRGLVAGDRVVMFPGEAVGEGTRVVARDGAG